MKKKILKELMSTAIYLLVVLGLTWLLITYVIQRTEVDGSSMEPTLSSGDNLFVDKISYRFHDPERFDIIVFPFLFNIIKKLPKLSTRSRPNIKISTQFFFLALLFLMPGLPTPTSIFFSLTTNSTIPAPTSPSMASKLNSSRIISQTLPKTSKTSAVVS